MNHINPYLVILAGMLFLSPTYAADQKALANVKGCFACHDIKTKKIGPAYKDVAKKYAEEKGATDKLVKKVLEGGKGVWGNVPMPANKTMGVTEADAKKLVTWILSLK
jgi:cytochrome c